MEDNSFKFSKLKNLCIPQSPKKLGLSLGVIQIAGCLCGLVYSFVNYFFAKQFDEMVARQLLPLFVISVILELISVILSTTMLVGLWRSCQQLILPNLFWQFIGICGSVCGIVITSLAIARYEIPSNLILIISGFHHKMTLSDDHIIVSASIGYLTVFVLMLFAETYLVYQIRRLYLFVKHAKKSKPDAIVTVTRF